MNKAIIFDMDGVLIDSEYTFFESKTKVLLDEGINSTPSYHAKFMGSTFVSMWESMKHELSLSRPVEEYIKKMEKYRKEIIFRDGIKPIKGVVEFVHYLKKMEYPLAVASSSPKNEILTNLHSLGILECFNFIISGEEVAHSKPAPDIFLKAAKLLGHNPEDCVVFEDSQNGIIAAKSAGMYCIGFSNPNYPTQNLSGMDQKITEFDNSLFQSFYKNL